MLRLTVSVLVLALATGCGPTRSVLLDTGHGAPREFPQATSHQAISVEADAFEDSLSRMVLAAPLTLRAPGQGWLQLASHSTQPDTRWRRLMSKSFGGYCPPGQLRDDCLSLHDDCLSLLDDVRGLGPWDKLGVALAMSLQPLKASISQATPQPMGFEAYLRQLYRRPDLLARFPDGF